MGSWGSGDAVASLGTETRAGALALRDVCLTVGDDEGKKGGAGSWRDCAILRGEVIEVGLWVVKSWECCILEEVLFNSCVRERPELFPSFLTTGSKYMEVFCCGDCVRFSSITRDFVNRRHSESMSIVGVEGEQGEVAGVRNHLGEGISGAERRGGGYVVGNA